MESTLEKAGNLATDTLNKIKEDEAKKTTAESKDAADAEAKAKAEKEKVEGQKLADAEAQAAKDEEILSKDEKDLSEDEKKRKVEILEAKEKKLTPEDKIKRVQEQSQKRIDEIKSELLEERNKRNQDKELIKRLEAEMAEMKKLMQPKVDEDAKVKAKREEDERIAKYIEEDKAKPRSERREMTKEELQAWYLDEPDEATAWITERSLRRAEERKQKAAPAKEDEAEMAEAFIENQRKSAAKLFAKYPGTNPSKEELKKYAGKSRAEIHEALMKDNAEYRLCQEIVAEDPKKYLESVNGPELVMAEMEKRLAASNNSEEKKPKTVTLTEEELEAKIQAEADRRASLDEGITSTKRQVKVEKGTQKSDLRQHQERIAKKAGMNTEQLDKVIKRRETIPGAGSYKEQD